MLPLHIVSLVLLLQAILSHSAFELEFYPFILLLVHLGLTLVLYSLHE